jgi:hypothetical protein
VNHLTVWLLYSIFMLDPSSTTGKVPEIRREPLDWRLVLNSLVVFRENPFAVDGRFQLAAQRVLYSHPSPALRDNHVLFGIDAKINPTATRIGPSIEFQPLSVAGIRVRAEWVDYFGILGSLQSFQSPAEDYSDSTLSRRLDESLNYATTGMHAAIEPMLQFGLPIARLGFLAVRERLSAEYWNMSLHSPASSGGRKDTVFYDSAMDTLVPADGWALQSDLDLVFQTKFSLIVGIRYTAIHPLYDRTAFLSEAEADGYKNDNDIHRMGPVIVYNLVGREAGARNRLGLLLVANWYLGHRWRTGQDVSAAIPYFLLGLTFNCDLLGRSPSPTPGQ